MNELAKMAIAAAVATAAVLLLPLAGVADDGASPIFGVTIPQGYRDWPLIGVGREDSLGELRGVVGNAIALQAYRNGKLPFPDGSVLVKLAWKQVPIAGLEGAFTSDTPTTIQVMVKDAAKYGSTGGWGFGRFVGGRPADEAQHRTCFACHQAHAKDHDFVFTRYGR
ncbi:MULTISPECIES: cytochrome P460 family protein [unclassified Bradyrhizobium]|uniref:cytochrome P460 family protein n=2 Tax=Bradyrhizobium TaxID=374 RepID=UPI0028E4F002|nr:MULTISPECIES: cytochrome P460 family protein [unclassified Bradyrhizobium]